MYLTRNSSASVGTAPKLVTLSDQRTPKGLACGVLQCNSDAGNLKLCWLISTSSHSRFFDYAKNSSGFVILSDKKESKGLPGGLPQIDKVG